MPRKALTTPTWKNFVRQLLMSEHFSICPGGSGENSPAIHRWECCFSRPSGIGWLCTQFPALKRRAILKLSLTGQRK